MDVEPAKVWAASGVAVATILCMTSAQLRSTGAGTALQPSELSAPVRTTASPAADGSPYAANSEYEAYAPPPAHWRSAPTATSGVRRIAYVPTNVTGALQAGGDTHALYVTPDLTADAAQPDEGSVATIRGIWSVRDEDLASNLAQDQQPQTVIWAYDAVEDTGTVDLTELDGIDASSMLADLNPYDLPANLPISAITGLSPLPDDAPPYVLDEIMPVKVLGDELVEDQSQILNEPAAEGGDVDGEISDLAVMGRVVRAVDQQAVYEELTRSLGDENARQQLIELQALRQPEVEQQINEMEDTRSLEVSEDIKLAAPVSGFGGEIKAIEYY